GTTSAVPVMGIDFYPTILDMVGVTNYNAKEIDGESFLPILTGAKSKLKRKSLFWHYPHYHRTKPYGSILDNNWKLLEFFEDGKLELYNLTTDPNETTNLASTNVVKVRKMKKKLEKWRASVGAQMMKQNPNYNPEKEAIRVK
ncbi:MAG: sulfatase/phosphatase domain-containing protein, partial [Cellulophaga sp.]